MTGLGLKPLFFTVVVSAAATISSTHVLGIVAAALTTALAAQHQFFPWFETHWSKPVC